MGIWTPLSVFCASRLVDTPPWPAYKSSLRLHYHSPLLLTSSTTAPPLTPCAATTISRAIVLTVFSGLLDTLDIKVGRSAVFLVRFMLMMLNADCLYLFSLYYVGKASLLQEGGRWIEWDGDPIGDSKAPCVERVWMRCEDVLCAPHHAFPQCAFRPL